MKLKKINIRKFRSIQECTIQMNDICGLVGENNSGKSAILRALNAFFNYSEEEASFIKGDHSYSPNSKPVIELTFTEVPGKEFYQDKIVNDELVVKLTCINGSSTRRRSFQYKKNGYHDLGIDFINKIKEDINYVFIPLNRDHSQLKFLKNTFTLNKFIERYITSKNS